MKAKKIIITIALALLFLSSIAYFYRANTLIVREVSFSQLPGWDKAEFSKSLLAFQTSCRAFIKQDPERIVGTDKIDLQVKDWQPTCQAALGIAPVDENSAKQFFQQWFSPVEFYNGKLITGLFTGYYMPLLKGSYTQSAEFNVPIYEVPKNLITVDLGLYYADLKNRKVVGRLQDNKLVPFYTREEINNGAVDKTAPVLLWVKNKLDRLFMEIQGTGIIELEDGKRVYIGYDAQNGFPYTAVGGVLIKRGILTRENASMQAIKKFFDANPQQTDEVINQNKSFVFFRKLSLDAALGSQGVALTPGYSLAIDKQWIPMGAPLWLSTSRPDVKNPSANKPMRRLMIAQDTGGAIRGTVRGDVFWGGGDRATLIAGHMKNEGHYWLLLPKHTLSRIGR